VSSLDIPEGSLFGPATLPYGVFSTPGGAPRAGVRLGDSVVDLAVALGDARGGTRIGFGEARGRVLPAR
jgi:fumarylacetoacetase